MAHKSIGVSPAIVINRQEFHLGGGFTSSANFNTEFKTQTELQSERTDTQVALSPQLLTNISHDTVLIPSSTLNSGNPTIMPSQPDDTSKSRCQTNNLGNNKSDEVVVTPSSYDAPAADKTEQQQK